MTPDGIAKTSMPNVSYPASDIAFPIDVLTPAEAAEACARFHAMEAEHGGTLPAHVNHKPHLLYPWIFDLVMHPRILASVEGVLGPDLLCWSTQFFAKKARDPSFVSWHQDATYWGLSSPVVTTQSSPPTGGLITVASVRSIATSGPCTTVSSTITAPAESSGSV
jgi:hypothetical protein